jgi:hypothetical protein
VRVTVVKRVPDFFGRVFDNWGFSSPPGRGFRPTNRNEWRRGRRLRGSGRRCERGRSARLPGPAASGIGEDSGSGVDFSRFVPVFARRSRFDRTPPTAETSGWPRGGEQASLSSERQGPALLKGREVPTPFHLDGGRGLNLIVGSDSLVARVGPTTRMPLALAETFITLKFTSRIIAF